jgi:S1-C subfamily serine protease
MYLRPLARPDEDVGRFDRSGMWINLASAGFQIMDIAPGGPADEAGLKVGDVITAIGAIPYDRRSLSETRRALRLVPLSRPLEVSYRRGSSSGVARLFPRDLIPD